MTTKTILANFENENAILLTNNQEKIFIPKNILPKNCKENDTIWLNIINNHNENNEFAKDVLNEILEID